MAMHVEERGQEGSASSVDHRRDRRSGRAGLVERRDAPAVNIHVLRRSESRAFGIEHPCVADDNRLGQRVAQLGGELAQPLVVGFNLPAF